MKSKIIMLLFAICAVTTAVAQGFNKKTVATLESNLNTIAELEKLIASDYTLMDKPVNVVSAKSFQAGQFMMLTSFADDAAMKQADALEKDFNGTFEKSVWKFDAINPNSTTWVKVTTQKGQTEQSGYTPSGAMIRIGSLVQGLDINAYFYQNKKETGSYIMLFAVGNGMACVAEFTSAAGK
ncbi:MAG: hypothetical protein JNM14_01580 [Ferruginibacter sp.]|nr:hypothetical protein [Ferruginibacter sp.]